MMFLQFFLWGSWYVTAPAYLGKIGFAGSDIGWTYSVGPIAGMISPIFVGLVADRFFAAERLLGALNLLGAAAMYYAMTLMRAESPDPALINVAFFAHMLCYYPTLALTNTLAMRNLSDTQRQFPVVRAFGTLGWIVAGFTISQLAVGAAVGMFQVAVVAGVVLGVYSLLVLPHTPPTQTERGRVRDMLGLDALSLLRDRNYAIFLFCSFLICIPLAFYYQLAARGAEAAGLTDIGFKMAYGQMSEAVFMVLMPLCFARLGVKWMLAVGMLAWVARYAMFSYGIPSDAQMLVLVGIALHGICYDFFFVTGQIYTDQRSPSAIRGQAQGFLVFCTLGVGMFFGAKIGGEVEAHYTPPAAAALLGEAGKGESERNAIARRFDLGQVPDAEREAVTARDKALESEVNTKRLAAYEQMDWASIWKWPAIGAGIVLLLFLASFRAQRPQVEG
jgi:nucleoside transporter